MLLHKWCPFLMRRMSPLKVGLIWFCLIGVSSLSFQPQTYPVHPTASAAVKLKNYAILPSSAKHIHQTKLHTEGPRTSFKVSFSSGPIINNGSSTDTEPRNKRIPKLNLSSRLKVRNRSGTNSTIVYLPRLSRSMTNFSSNSVNTSLQPIIVSSHRRILLDPKEFKIRPVRNSPKLNNTSSQFGSKLMQKVSKNSTSSDPKKINLRPPAPFSKNSSSSDLKKINSRPLAPFSKNSTSIDPKRFGTRIPAFSSKMKPTVTPNNRTVFNAGNSNSLSFSESTLLVNIKRNDVNSKRNYTILQFLPTNISSRNRYHRNFPQFYRRQGRNLNPTDFDSGVNAETSSEEFISLPIFNNKTIGSISKIRKKSLTPTQVVPGLKRAASVSREVTSSEREEDNSSVDLGYAYTLKKAKNLTIYEILKPRLKGSTNISEIMEFSPDQNSFSLQNDAVFHQIKDIEENESSNANIVDTDGIDNDTLVTSGFGDEVADRVNPVSILPDVSDYGFGIKYVIVNRSNSEVHPSDPSQNADDPGGTSTDPPENEDPIQNRDKDAIVEEKENTTQDVFTAKISRGQNNEAVYLLENNTNKTGGHSNSREEEKVPGDDSEYLTLLYGSDSIRRPKMTENTHSNNAPFKNPKMDSKMFYDYFAKRPVGNLTLREFPYPEYRPGNMFRYSDIYQRQPILDVVYTRPTSILRPTTTEAALEETPMVPTTFNSLRTSVRVLSTFYPNRMQDVTMKFGNRIETTTLPYFGANDKKLHGRNDEDPDDAEYRDSLDPGFTMEKLAYLLIGTCCGLSILCLFVVVIAIKCRRAIVEKRLKAQFRKRLYHHERMKDMTSPWQQQVFDHFMYLQRRPGDSSCSSNTDSCNCRCVTWSLGPRNLDATRPLCPPTTNRSSLYLYGQKKLPFGAASTLRFESMLGRKRSSPENRHHPKNESPHTDSSHENDSLDMDSDSREGDGPKHCTCIDYNVWPMPPANVPRGFFTLCPNPGRYNVGNCSQHPPVELRTIARDLPPPVTGSNYLDRSEGVVYWSSNDERLI